MDSATAPPRATPTARERVPRQRRPLPPRPPGDRLSHDHAGCASSAPPVLAACVPACANLPVRRGPCVADRCHSPLPGRLRVIHSPYAGYPREWRRRVAAADEPGRAVSAPGGRRGAQMVRRRGRRPRQGRRRIRPFGCLLFVLGLIILLFFLSLMFGGFQKGTKVGLGPPAWPAVTSTALNADR